MIPRRLIRSVPAETTVEVEEFWAHAGALHQGWEMVTYRDPVDPMLFPITSPLWVAAGLPGAQTAGLIRLEALVRSGGIWLDSDVQLYRPLTPLLQCSAFACWEDEQTVPDAVLGAEHHHLAIMDCLKLAVTRLLSASTEWRTGNGPWSTGPGVTTTILPGRDDVLLLPPGSFYPVHYSEKEKTHSHAPAPWSFGIHHWAGSWLP